MLKEVILGFAPSVDILSVKNYTPKYRQEAAHLVIETGRTVAAVAREIGVGEALLGRWVAIERSRMG